MSEKVIYFQDEIGFLCDEGRKEGRRHADADADGDGDVDVRYISKSYLPTYRHTQLQSGPVQLQDPGLMRYSSFFHVPDSSYQNPPCT